MSQIDENITHEIDDGLGEAFECYLSMKDKLGVKSTGKGIMNLIREDSVLSKKITFEEAVLMNPSILADVENGEQILEQIRTKYQQPDAHEIDDGLEEAIDTYLQTVNENNGNQNKVKIK